MKYGIIKLITAATVCALLFAAQSCTPSTADTTANTPETPELTASETEPDETETAVQTDTEAKGGLTKTSKVLSLTFKSIYQRADSDKRDILIYCETEKDATVFICDNKGNVLCKDTAYGNCFYTVMELEEGVAKRVYVYAQAEGKAVSDYVKAELCHTAETGKSAFVSHNSRLFLNFYDDFYYGRLSVDKDHMNAVKNLLHMQIEQARALTGKDTKMIFVIATNPATVYHDLQYDEPFGRGDYFEETPTTRFVDFMKGDDDIYVVDCRAALMAHRDEYIIYQTDSHWTQLGAYYCYLEMMKYVSEDFPTAKVYNKGDYRIDEVWYAGDLLSGSFINGAVEGMGENAPVFSTRGNRYYAKDAPTCYIVGDSYTGSIDIFLQDTFKTCYYNDRYTYVFSDLAAKKPDYLIYVFTERNVSADLGILFGGTMQ